MSQKAPIQRQKYVTASRTNTPVTAFGPASEAISM